jgi:hypothetical protein
MARNGMSLEEKQNWMRENRSVSIQARPTVIAGAFAERHYAVQEIAAMWNLSRDAIRKLFEDEPGVIALGDGGSACKRRYRTLRIPESVVQRVHRRLTNV